MAGNESLKTWSVYKNEIVFISQVLIVYIVVFTSIVNLSINNGDSNLWIALLGSCLGYILPSPKLKATKVVTQSEPPIPL